VNRVEKAKGRGDRGEAREGQGEKRKEGGTGRGGRSRKKGRGSERGEGIRAGVLFETRSTLNVFRSAPNPRAKDVPSGTGRPDKKSAIVHSTSWRASLPNVIRRSCPCLHVGQHKI